MSPTDLLAAGTAALERGAWQEARTHLQASVAASETPQALERLGLAAWWLDDAALTFDARERAYRLYREQGDELSAARVALWLVWDCHAFRGDTAVASGWLERARRLLSGHERSAQYGWLLLREGEGALFRGHDPATARDHAVRAAALGRETGDPGLEFLALALEGIARVSAGDVTAGMRCLDEATAAATAGEVKELHTVSLVCCWQIFACERIRDYDRAAQWCARVQEFAKRWGLRPLSATCRTQYAGVLIWRGKWGDAETELTIASRDFEQARPPFVGQALARLGELRLRQGRLDDAERLFTASGTQPLARLGLAELALERDAPAEAAAELDRFLAQVGDGEPTMRAGALELAVRAHVARGEAAAAERAHDELRQIAREVGTVPLAASAAAAEGTLLRCRGDAAAAVSRLEAAVASYEESGAPFESARTRLELADALAATGEHSAALREARQALDGFTALGADRDARRAKDTIRRLEEVAGSGRGGGRKGKRQLTGRQLEILRLVAQGLSNPDIAARLHLSDHTVKRHVANLLTKLRVSSRAAAAAYAAHEGLI
ncbi:MAG TPA: LuxR C-terminal-related transcriptional regulator [Gemmatimonadales bacterium]|nr:LuxR C-terminal-related transcriptional regulator [Gemmatimonadales bacterium]